ncbi:PepSY domain-containing protein [Ramlibacter sp. MMS24-I3-19]|uniref:PepSY domain-containing protein n=1 Tax=Ramlibacter sp. MMS24-I3-19 TaxID=3416606 RepID=UPI003CFCE56D
MFKPVLSVLALAGAVCFTHAIAAEPSQAQLQAQAKISQEQATATALSRVPNGKVQSVELEREHGKLVWSFDIAQEGRSGVSEIQVDARNGKIVSQKQESASEEASEASKEAQEK